MKTLKMLAVVVMILAAAVCGSEGAVDPLHEFTGGAEDGAWPEGDLTISNGTIYGMTPYGGLGSGTIFKMNINDINSFTVPHKFADGANDGASPHGSLTLSGSTLYGMTEYGGSGQGTIFSINTNLDESSFTVIHPFAGGLNDGARPSGNVIVSSNALYGMTYMGGGSPGQGTIFKKIIGEAGITLYKFSNGAYPGTNSLTLSGSTLYGSTSYGGGQGTIFSINTDLDQSSYTVLHTFVGGEDDGSYPMDSLMLSGTTLYGMTNGGGSGTAGTIFKIDTSGDPLSFTLLHEFVGGAGDGADPYWHNSLTLVGDTLYGMTSGGGEPWAGTIFKMNPNDTNSFTVLHEFDGVSAGYPYGSLTLSGGKLYGMTEDSTNNEGNIFSFSIAQSIIEDSYAAMGLTFDAAEMAQLAQLYYDGEAGLNPSPIPIDGLEWAYFPQQIAGKQPGDSWYNPQNGIYYFYFGSGVMGQAAGGGQVPEPSTLLLLLLPLLGFGIRRFRKKM